MIDEFLCASVQNLYKSTSSTILTFIFVYNLYSNQAEAVTTLLEAGANVNSTVHGLTPLRSAATIGNHRIIRAIATTPGIMLDAQVRVDYSCAH